MCCVSSVLRIFHHMNLLHTRKQLAAAANFALGRPAVETRERRSCQARCHRIMCDTLAMEWLAMLHTRANANAVRAGHVLLPTSASPLGRQRQTLQALIIALSLGPQPYGRCSLASMKYACDHVMYEYAYKRESHQTDLSPGRAPLVGLRLGHRHRHAERLLLLLRASIWSCDNPETLSSSPLAIVNASMEGNR